MADKKYPIGTKIRFLSGCCEKGRGKEGEIVKIAKGYPVILIPECTCLSEFSTRKCPASVQTGWWNIEKIVQKNQQLLFSFMG
jgi:hypothetical protein